MLLLQLCIVMIWKLPYQEQVLPKCETKNIQILSSIPSDNHTILQQKASDICDTMVVNLFNYCTKLYALTVFAKLWQLTFGLWATEKHGLEMKREFLTWMLLTLEQILKKQINEYQEKIEPLENSLTKDNKECLNKDWQTFL